MSDRKSQAISLWKRLLGGERLIRVPSDNPTSDQKGLWKAFDKMEMDVTVSKDPDGDALWIKQKKSH